MRYLSVCSGIEAASVAWEPLGWSPVAFSEIEPFPSTVLAERFPSVPNWGDMTKFREWPDACRCGPDRYHERVGSVGRTFVRGGGGRRPPIYADEGAQPRGGNIPSGGGVCETCGGTAIDLLVGGTPCQSFSVAGLRKGMADPRGNLALTYLAIADRYRPEWMVWENVPGVLSSNGGRDFGAFIGGLAELGYHAAWRVLDAQYVRVDGLERAVPQRRRRVFVVGHLGDWRRSAAVLLERTSLSGHPPPRRQAGEGVAGTVAGNTNRTSGYRNDADTTENLIAGKGGYAGRRQEDDDNLVCLGWQNSASQGDSVSSEISPCLDKSKTPAVAHPYTLAIIREGYAVRRLTPTECSRLQGFPDNWTAITYRGKPAADGPRYKALGNSMAVNCMRWLGRRIQMVDAIASRREAV